MRGAGALARLLLGAGALLLVGCAQRPSFDCNAASGSVATLICQQPALAALDRKLAWVYGDALEVASAPQQTTLRGEQRGWIKGRDECWKSAMPIACIGDSYRHRIAELQARFGLLPATGPFTYHCDDAEVQRVEALFFSSDPATALVSREDRSEVLFLVPAGSGAKYEGGNIMLWSQGDHALIRWGFAGYGHPTLECRLAP